MARTTMTSSKYTMRSYWQRGSGGLMGKAYNEKCVSEKRKWLESRCEKSLSIRK